MKRNLLFFVILMTSSLVGSVAAQTKTVTNADLEKFRQQRLKAEKEYRENYDKWGMPSPEELEERRKQSAKELSETAARYRAERLEQERSEAEMQSFASEYNYLRSLSAPVSQYYSQPNGYYYPGVYYSNGGNYRLSYGRRGYTQQYGPGNIPLPTLRPPKYDFLPGSILPTRRRH
jgi:hypothetical protein